MNIQIRELKDDYINMVIEGIEPGFINMIRRTVISDIPKMAIEDVFFRLGTITYEGKDYESILPLFNEIVAHRLGMLPIPTDLDFFNFRDKCGCEDGCSKCSIEYILDEKGPKDVYSGDLRVLTGWFLADKKDLEEKFKIKYKNIPIIKLNENQAILLSAIAILGTGKEHAKWQSTSGVGYTYYPSIMINNDKCDKCGACVKNCPVNIIIVEGKKLVVNDVEKCTLCERCKDVCEKGAIKIKFDDSKFIFKFEVDGTLTTKDVMNYAIKYLKEKFCELEKKIGEIE